MLRIKKVEIKTLQEQELMRIAGRLAASCLEMLDDHVKPGVSTLHLDTICHDFIVNDLQAVPACLGYNGYPKTLCISKNGVACHGIPATHEILEDGDIVNIDVTIIKDGFHGDTSKMYCIGDVSDEARKFSNAAYTAMAVGIQEVAPGKDFGVIGEATELYILSTDYSVVPEYSGHGIGKIFHDSPAILAIYNRLGVMMQPGMTFTVEPIINYGHPQTECLADNWTVITIDGSLSAQYEHTILVTENGYEVLTLRKDEADI